MREKRKYVNLARYLSAVVFCLLFVFTAKAQAGASMQDEFGPSVAPKLKKTFTFYFKENYSEEYKVIHPEPQYITVANFPNHILIEEDNVNHRYDGYKTSKLKLSKKNIAKVDYMKGTYYSTDLTILVFPVVKNKKIQTGKTTLSFTVTKGKKKYPLSCDIIIRKAPNPFKSLKINGKEYASSFNKYWTINVPFSKKAKITYKLKSKKYKLFYYSDGYKKIKFKSGSTVKVGKNLYVNIKKFSQRESVWEMENMVDKYCIDLTKKEKS